MFGRLLEAAKMALESFTSILFVTVVLMLLSFCVVLSTSRLGFIFLMSALSCWSVYAVSVLYHGFEADLLTFGLLSVVCAQAIYFYRYKEKSRRMVDSF